MMLSGGLLAVPIRVLESIVAPQSPHHAGRSGAGHGTSRAGMIPLPPARFLPAQPATLVLGLARPHRGCTMVQSVVARRGNATTGLVRDLAGWALDQGGTTKGLLFYKQCRHLPRMVEAGL